MGAMMFQTMSDSAYALDAAALLEALFFTVVIGMLLIAMWCQSEDDFDGE